MIPISEKDVFTARLHPSSIAVVTCSNVPFIKPKIIDMLISIKKI
jgi:hypothetical protein